MDQQFILNLILLVSLPVCVFIGYFLSKLSDRKTLKTARQEADKIIQDAVKLSETKVKELELNAREEWLKQQDALEQSLQQRRQELKQSEERLYKAEEALERRLEMVDQKEADYKQGQQVLLEQEKQLSLRASELDQVIAKQIQVLENVSSLSVEEAKRLILSKLEDDLQFESAQLVRKYEQEALDVADKKAKDIIGVAIKKYAAGHVAESTIAVVEVPSDEMKGRIIGREGRNIRALEAATGVNVIVDDTPGTVVLSGFDPVRREIAKITLERLIRDGRIHPTRIDEVVEQVSLEMDAHIKELGEQLALETGVQGLHPDVIKLIGRLNYRTSYGQNIWHHSKEVAYLMAAMAEELHLDVDLAKRCGLLHDLGKAVTHEVEGSHAAIGAELARKYGEKELVVNAIEAHHEDVEAQSIYAVLVCAADAISASRPGARRSTIDEYINRLDKLEAIARSFSGVEKSFAIQAGREIRVVVQPDSVDEAKSVLLARDIAHKIEQELTYPGQIKITVVRETKVVEYAK